MKFLCPHCQHPLSADAHLAGHWIDCPVCTTRLQIPAIPSPPGPQSPQRLQPRPPAARPPNPAASDATSTAGPTSQTEAATEATQDSGERRAWKEQDPTNPNLLISGAIGFGLLVIWYAVLFPFNPAPEMAVADYSAIQYLASLFYKHLLVSMTNTLFFTWAIAILFLKHQKIRHQKSALLLDVLPMQLGRQITSENVGLFIDHLYQLPKRLRDSMMVNRIRKGLELFEIRPNTGDVREMMASQSEIDGARIGGSFTLLRAFLWAIPLLGFIGTVVGLSHAIGGMNFANVEDVQKIVGSINKVTSGLGTAFDATLLGLVLAMTLNFPLNSLAKQEDDNLNTIDAFCIEVLLPRLKDAAEHGEQDAEGIAKSVAAALSKTQDQFLANLDQLAKRMNEYAQNLDTRMEAFQKSVTETLVDNTAKLTDDMKSKTDASLQQSMDQVSKYIGGLETGIKGLNNVLKDLGERQVIVDSPRKRRWFSRE